MIAEQRMSCEFRRSLFEPSREIRATIRILMHGTDDASTGVFFDAVQVLPKDFYQLLIEGSGDAGRKGQEYSTVELPINGYDVLVSYLWFSPPIEESTSAEEKAWFARRVNMMIQNAVSSLLSGLLPEIHSNSNPA